MRTHFIEWAARLRRKSGDEDGGGGNGGQKARGDAAKGELRPELDVARQPRVKMADHAGYKYLLHLDGQSCSSR